MLDPPPNQSISYIFWGLVSLIQSVPFLRLDSQASMVILLASTGHVPSCGISLALFIFPSLSLQWSFLATSGFGSLCSGHQGAYECYNLQAQCPFQLPSWLGFLLSDFLCSLSLLISCYPYWHLHIIFDLKFPLLGYYSKRT